MGPQHLRTATHDNAKPKTPRRRWDGKSLRQFVVLYETGRSVRTIGRALKLTPKQCEDALDAAVRLDLTERKAKRRRWTEDELVKIWVMHDSNPGVAATATELAMSEREVRNALRAARHRGAGKLDEPTRRELAHELAGWMWAYYKREGYAKRWLDFEDGRVYVRLAKREKESAQATRVEIANVCRKGREGNTSSLDAAERPARSGWLERCVGVVERFADAKGAMVTVENVRRSYMRAWFERRGYTPEKVAHQCYARDIGRLSAHDGQELQRE